MEEGERVLRSVGERVLSGRRRARQSPEAPAEGKLLTVSRAAGSLFGSSNQRQGDR